MCGRGRAVEERNYPWVLRDLPPTAKARSMLTEPQGEQRSDKGRQGFLGPPGICLRAGLFLQILTAVGVVGSHKLLPLPRLPARAWKSLLALEPSP